MYGIFTYVYHKNPPNAGKYTIHGWYGKNTCHIIPTWVRFMEETLVGMKKSPFQKPMKNIKNSSVNYKLQPSKSLNTTCKVGHSCTSTKDIPDKSPNPLIRLISESDLKRNQRPTLPARTFDTNERAKPRMH